MQKFVPSLLIVLLLSTSAVFAQPAYNNPELGIAADFPASWEVRIRAEALLAASPTALAALDAGETPQDLVLSIITSSFVEMEISAAAEIPDQLKRLVPAGTTAPEPLEIQLAGYNGWQVEYAVADSGLTTRVILLALSNGRLALIRGMAATSVWDAAQFEAVAQSLQFSLPTAFADPLANLPDNDGGVLWHYQATQPAEAKPVTLGGADYDPFLLMYFAAGERGVLVLDETNGAFVNYLGAWFDDDNFVDLDIGTDTKIYLANATPGDNNHVMIVNRVGAYEGSFGFAGDAAGQFAPGMPRTLALTRTNEIWTVSEGHSTPPTRRLYKFDRFGNLLANIDLDAVNPTLANIRIDFNINTSELYLVGESGGLNVLDAEGQVLVTNLGTEIFSTITPVDVTIAPNNNIIVATDTAGFLEFAPSGAVLDRFGIPIDSSRTDRFQPSEYWRVGGMVVGSDGVMYFAETNPNSGFSQVQAFRFAGDGTLPLPNRPSSGTSQGLNLDPATGGGDIAYGAVVQAGLNNQYPAHDWVFEGEAGDQIRITMRDVSSGDLLDTTLILLDGNRAEIAQNDDIGNAAPDGFKPTDSVIEMEIRGYGFYTIRATRFGGRGEYELMLEKLNP